jgi:signal transduction histidine kinase
MRSTFRISVTLVALAVLALLVGGVVTGRSLGPLALALAMGGLALIALGAAWLLARRTQAAMAAHSRALADLGAREQRVTAFAGVNAALSQELDTEALLRRITDTLAQLTGAPCVVLWGTDLAGRRLVRQAWTMEPEIARLNLPYELTFDQGATGWIARHHEAVIISDVATDVRMYAAAWCLEHGLNAFAGAPVLEGGELAGVLTLNMRDIDALGEGGQALLVSFAAQAALAIRNARLISEAQRRRREAEALAALGRRLAQTLDPEAMAQELADSLRALLGTRTSGLYRLDAATGDIVSVAISGDLGPGLGRVVVFPQGTGVAALAARERRPVITANLLTDPRITLTPEVRSRIEQAVYRAVLSVPLVARDAAIGALSVGDDEGRAFTPDDVRLAEAVADQAALTLDNARLYVEATGRRREAEELARVARSLTESLDVVDVGRRIVDGVRPLLGLAFSRLRLKDPDGSLRAIAWSGAVPDIVGPENPLPAGAGVAGRAVQEGRPVWSADFARDAALVLSDELRDYAARSEARSVLGVPLRVRGEIIGSLTVGDQVGRVFAASEVTLLEAFADQAALALDNARLYEQTRARLRALQETQAQLVQAAKLSAVGQLVSGVAHELNNPLSVVIGHGQLMLTRNPPPEIRRPVELIVSQGDRMAKIVQSLLLFSRQRATARGPVDLPEIFEQTLVLRAAQLRLSGVTVTIEHEPGLPPADGDAQQLQQVILNLLLNAEQALLQAGQNLTGPSDAESRLGSRIVIRTSTRTEAERDWVRVELEDNGPGIAPEVLPRIFEPFFTTKAVGQGTGLGLSVSYGIIQQHGGRLTAQSEPGRTVFAFELPRWVPGSPSPVSTPEAIGRTDGAGRAVLVVDDEPEIVDLVVTILRQDGWKVDVAESGRAGLERVRGARYDLIVSDFRMPDGDGEAFYRAAVEAQPELMRCFLFMTGDTANPVAWQFLQDSRIAVMEKPFSPDALRAAIMRLGS